MLKKTSSADLRAVFGTVTPKTARCTLVEKHKSCVVVNYNSEPRSKVYIYLSNLKANLSLFLLKYRHNPNTRLVQYSKVKKDVSNH